MKHHMLCILPNGDFMDWGRSAMINGVRGEGSPYYYTGEAAEVMRIVLKYSEPDRIKVA